jgi:hypothetical protein
MPQSGRRPPHHSRHFEREVGMTASPPMNGHIQR